MFVLLNIQIPLLSLHDRKDIIFHLCLWYGSVHVLIAWVKMTLMGVGDKGSVPTGEEVSQKEGVGSKNRNQTLYYRVRGW